MKKTDNVKNITNVKKTLTAVVLSFYEMFYMCNISMKIYD